MQATNGTHASVTRTMCSKMSPSGTSASPNREPRNSPRGTKCRPDWAGLDCQGSPDNRRRCGQQQHARIRLKRPTDAEETPREARRQGLTREILETQVAIKEQPKGKEKTLTHEDTGKTRTPQKEISQRPTEFWLLANLTPSMTWTWTARETQRATEWASAVLDSQPKATPEYLEEKAALPKLMAKLQGRWIPALLDTGAVQSFIHPDVVRQAQLEPLWREGGIKFTGPSGDAVTTTLLAKNIPITTGTRTYKWDAWVAPLRHPLILGYDFIKQYIKQWDVQEGRLWWQRGATEGQEPGMARQNRADAEPAESQGQEIAERPRQPSNRRGTTASAHDVTGPTKEVRTPRTKERQDRGAKQGDPARGEKAYKQLTWKINNKGGRDPERRQKSRDRDLVPSRFEDNEYALSQERNKAAGGNQVMEAKPTEKAGIVRRCHKHEDGSLRNRWTRYTLSSTGQKRKQTAKRRARRNQGAKSCTIRTTDRNRGRGRRRMRKRY